MNRSLPWAKTKTKFSKTVQLGVIVFAYVSPASDHVQQVVSAQGQVDDALVDRPAAALGGQVLLGYFHPPEGAHRKSDGALLGLRLDPGWVAAAPL
jgi:hypothetical protein